MRRRPIGVLAVAAVGLAGLTTAHAASVPVTAGVLSAQVAGPCTTATVSVTRTQPQYFLWIFLVGYRGVRLDDVPTTCLGRPLSITAGTTTADASVPAGTSQPSLEIALDTTYGTGVTSFPLTIDGWHVATSM